jgi:PPOX class probable FMN-dependent enzyme
MSSVHDPSGNHVVATEAQLDAVVGIYRPDPGKPDKQLDYIDAHARAFIATSPLVMLGTVDGDGRLDVSPRGDPPGFVQVLNDRELIIPERKGNHRVDSLRNILQRPHVGMLFLVPGREDTLRVNGRATISTDPELTARCAIGSATPKLVVVVEVAELYFHCARSLLRAAAWKPDRWPSTDHLASLGTALKDQMCLTDVSSDDIDANLDQVNNDLY